MKTPYNYFSDGLAARYEGLPASACPLIFKAWPHDCWQLGWQLADIEHNVKSGNVEQEPLERILKRPFDQGQIAFMQGRAFNDCPYGLTTPDGYNWQAGWIAGNEAANPSIEVKWNWPVILVISAFTLAIIGGLMWAL